MYHKNGSRPAHYIELTLSMGKGQHAGKRRYFRSIGDSAVFYSASEEGLLILVFQFTPSYNAKLAVFDPLPYHPITLL